MALSIKEKEAGHVFCVAGFALDYKPLAMRQAVDASRIASKTRVLSHPRQTVATTDNQHKHCSITESGSAK